MVSGREPDAHKLPRVASSYTGSSDIPETQIKVVSPSEIGQHLSCGIHKQSGRNSLPRVGGLSEDTMDVVLRTKHPHHSPTPARCTKAHCQCGVSDNAGSVRWQLNPILFKRIVNLLGPIEVDLFASRLTAQCPVYFSRRPDSYAAATDAFLQDWSQIQGYANLPWSLIG